MFSFIKNIFRFDNHPVQRDKILYFGMDFEEYCACNATTNMVFAVSEANTEQKDLSKYMLEVLKHRSCDAVTLGAIGLVLVGYVDLDGAKTKEEMIEKLEKHIGLDRKKLACNLYVRK